MYWLKLIVLAGGLLASAILAYTTYTASEQDQVANYGSPRGSNESQKKKRLCGICLKVTEPSEEVTLPCGHTFCSSCMRPLLSGTQTSCCDCRREIPPSTLNYWKSKLV